MDKQTVDDDQFAALLEASEAFDEDVGKLLGKCEAHDKRSLIASALCATAFEHGLSQRVLIGIGLTGTALALCRLHLEAVIRATWTAECADEEWLDRFTTPVEGPGHKEPAPKIAIDAMIKHIAAKVKHVGEEYALINTTVPAMHSFVHSGAEAVVHALMPTYPTYTLMGAIWNRNLLHLYTANTAAKAVDNGPLMPRYRLLLEKHAGCMPPTSKAQSIR